jgi:SAM-dependent methyltransferase
MNIEQLLAEKSGIRLDIGCGENKQPGFVGMDIRDLPAVDIVHDWNDIPWPLPDKSVLVAIASHVVEHINPFDFGFIKFMDEVWRVLRPGGEFAMALPHGLSQGYLQDPTHCNPCNENTFFYFTPGHPLYNIYKPKPWSLKFREWSPNANIEVILVKIEEAEDAR